MLHPDSRVTKILLTPQQQQIGGQPAVLWQTEPSKRGSKKQVIGFSLDKKFSLSVINSLV